MLTSNLIKAFENNDWRKGFLDRVIRTAAQGYAAGWIALGADFDGLLSVEPLKGAFVAVVLCVLFSLGATQVGDPTVNTYEGK
jgi:hypothetical protein